MLDEKTLALAQEVRALLGQGLEALAQAGQSTEAIRQALLDLEGPFLLVVVGEFNSGKSSLLNALLRGEFLKEGVTPTTDRIHLIGYGPEPKQAPEGPGLVRVELPHPLLKEVRLVDTPGTNAILQHHQLLTERFLPRADLILFVTSADRPFTQSEADFLRLIQSWGKKVVMVLHKADLLTDAELREVEAFVRKGAEQTLGHTPPTFPASARRARQGQEASSGIPALEAHIHRVLNQEAAQLKLSSPLGVLIRELEAAQPTLQKHLEEAQRQLSTCHELDQLLTRHEERIRRDFGGQVALALQVVEEVRARGERWLDEKVRLSRFLELLNSSRLKQGFIEEVVRGANQEIERRVLEALNWLTKRDRELLEDALSLLREAPGLHPGVQSNPETRAIAGNLEEALRSFDAEAEASQLRDHIQESLRNTALAEVGVVGLGLTVLLVTQKIALDVLGIFATLFGAILATSILPRRKEAAKARLRERLAELRGALEGVLRETLEAELSHTRERFHNLYRAPCGRLESQLERIRAQLERLDTLLRQAQDLRKGLGAW
ncbi:MAG: dynamin family protein [Meiothermus sp.]|uniref:dynamin family protein n=1 Tax=Meiothermus sp. TaxID=1955249 RepID=UPI0025F0A728|nr:dynamin family protein [Meiothermus sp.]MCS7057366.1 dynamin family protein [Meiothermus sp.]MCS7193348.1 dynamin family protein [Meiothermus sp.]MCX7741080.1 dynamin family protein [Meiothermus sp.]MDW8091755.1 dynamin family protein [Meiothermus sp.]MDW8480559.1 dynamin family protein [Meiothermus sp.]